MTSSAEEMPPADIAAATSAPARRDRRMSTDLRRSLMPYMFPLRSLVQPRRFHAYCIGAPKSGTHSIAGLFERGYRARHEPESESVIKMMLATSEGSADEGTVRRFLKWRDRRLWLELESSHLLCWFVETLVRQFRHAKFIVTIRDCYSWLDSYINHQLGRDIAEDMPFWYDLRDLYFRPRAFRHAEAERVLAENGLYTLDGYLSLWATHNHKVLAGVPADRLLVVRTQEIRHDVGRIAEFLRVPQQSLDVGQSHLYRAKASLGIVRSIERDFLEEKVDRYCGELMGRFFPDIRSLDDAIGA
jgi:Sulfotransferase domain